MVPHNFISQKLKKLQRAESLPFCPTVAAFLLWQCSLTPHDMNWLFQGIYVWQNPKNIYFAGKVYSKFIIQLAKKSNLIEIQDHHRKCSIHWSSLIKIQLRRKTLMVSFSANQKRRLRTSLRVVGFRYLCPLGCVKQIWIWLSYKWNWF